MSLKQKVLTGTKWIAFGNILTQVLQIVSLVIFARVLSPDDFGMFAILMIFVGFLNMFTDMGTSAALIHTEKPSSKLLSSVFYFNIFVGLLLCIVLIILSKPISLFFENPKLTELLQIISITFVITSFGVVQKTLYQKKLEFKHLTLIEVFSKLVGVIVGVSSVLLGAGVYGLLIQTLTNSFVLTVLMWIYSTWRPIQYFSISDIKNIWGYTANLTAFNFINYFARNADNFLIGKFLGSSALGVYSLAYKIMLYPLQNISNVLLRILFPAFSTIQNDNKKFKKVYLRIIFYIAIITFPLMAGLIATVDIFVDVLFGDKWNNLSIIIMILAPIGMIQSIVKTTGTIYKAKGSTNILFKIGNITTAVTVAFFIIGLPFGVVGVASGYLISNLVMLYPVLKISWREIDLTVKEGIHEILPILYISVIMGIGVKLVANMIDGIFNNNFIQLIIMICSGIVIYGMLIKLKYGSIKNILRELISKQ